MAFSTAPCTAHPPECPRSQRKEVGVLLAMEVVGPPSPSWDRGTMVRASPSTVKSSQHPGPESGKPEPHDEVMKGYHGHPI